MPHRFSVFFAVVASVVAMTLFCPANALCVMSKEILMSFNYGGMDLLPDVRVINAEGSVTYTITIKGQKKDRDDIYTADLTAEETYTRNSAKVRVIYRAWGKYVYDIKGYDENGRPCRRVTTLNIEDDKTILDVPANSYAMVGMYASKRKGVARFKLPDFAGGFPPHYTTKSSGCDPSPSESGTFLDIEFLSNLPRIPSFGTTKTDFAQSLNYYEEKATEELSGFVETTFDGKRSRGSKTFDIINGMTLPYLKASGEEVQDSM
jgi:hypothetical protein